MYSVSIGDDFEPPSLDAYDNYGGVEVLIFENNVDTSIEGTYAVIYSATNAVGTTFYTITVHVIDSSFPDLPPDVLEYYSSTTGLSGDDLKNELYVIVSSMTLYAYNKTSVPLSNIDRDVEDTDKVYLIYNGARVNYTWDSGTTWNKEHVWAKSLLGIPSWSDSHKGIGSDMHNLRAANPSINSSRGNKIFVSGSGLYGAEGIGWYPGDDHKGDVARIIFYMVTTYPELSFDTIGNLALFLQWHYEDPVDAFEISRNNLIYDYQENRNPYIDNPDFAYVIWGYPDSYNNDSNYIVLNVTFNYDYVDFIDKKSMFIN